MRKILIGILLLAGLGFAAYSFLFAKKKFISVLVFSKTEQFRHESIEAGKLAIMEMGKKYGFPVDTTEDASIFKEKSLRNYNVVVFLNTTGDILNDAQQLEFNRFIQAGGGFVGIHSATDTEYDWPWYGELVGAYFNGHPNDPNVREAILRVKNNAHLSTKSLPTDWKRNDEWYNFKNINPNLNVLINLDESTYEGGTNGENHPIAWYHEFDGGRSFYTGLGHTIESFSEPEFLDHLWGGLQYAIGEGNPVDYNRSSVAPEENRFKKVVLEDHLNEPMELEMLPDGKLLFVERGGAIRLFDPKEDSSRIILRLPVHTVHEDGLLGLTLDPDFATNRWVYLFYSPPGEKAVNVVSRMSLNEDYYFDRSSEKILLEVATQREECCHAAGSLEFGPNGNLFISTGDNTNPHASDGYSPTDERTDRSPWDAQKSSANTNDLRGKILRIKPEADGTYSIPDGNLFAKDGSEGRPEIYVMGCRNPYRISIDQKTGYLYWGDVGPDAGEDSLGRGPRGYDEVNQAKGPGFFGWPYFIGDNKPYNQYNFATQVSLDLYDQEKPVNVSPNNTGARELPPAQPAYIWYPYDNSNEFPLTGTGGRNAMAGPVYHFDQYPDNPGKYPEYYNQKLFTYDWMRGWIMAVSQDEEGALTKMERFLPSVEFNNIVDMIMGPNGDIYLLEYGTVWFSENPDARLVHLQYISGNRSPVASLEVDKSMGAAPLTVQFSGQNAIDYDGDDLSYEWSFDSDEVQSTLQNSSFTFDKAGKYTATLKVTDPSGESDESSIEILVGNDPPKVSWQLEGNKSFYWKDKPLNYQVSVMDKEDGTVSSDQVMVSIDYLERGFDKNEIALGHQAMQESSRFLLGKRLMEGSDCQTCHQAQQKSIGPSYVDIAQKYAKDPNAIDYLGQRIIKGGGGVWGETAMAAHPQLTTSETSKMIEYILSLADEKPLVKGLPLQGSYAFNQHAPGNTDGVYIFTASYTDKGGTIVGPLTARDVLSLRSPIVPAVGFSTLEKAMKFKLEPGQAPGFDEGGEFIIGMPDSYVMYEQLDLTSIKSVQLLIAQAAAYFGGGRMELRIDDPEGPVIGAIDVKQGLTDIGINNLTVNIEPTQDYHDLYVWFKPTKADEQKPVCAFILMEFGTGDEI